MGAGVNPPRPFWEALVVVEAIGTGQGEEMLEVIQETWRKQGDPNPPLVVFPSSY